MTQLQRLVIEYRGEEVVVRVLYKTGDAAKLGPNTKARTREVSDLARVGLTAALGPSIAKLAPSAWARPDSPRERISLWLSPVPTSLGRSPREAFSFLSITANCCS